jgi:hypothetical protein
VSRLAPAKTAPQRLIRPPSSWRLYEWNAKAAPLRTIPASIRVTGRNRAVEISANAWGNPVNRITTATTTQMWFVSQMGPMAWAMSSLWAGPRGPRLSRSHTPPPKSAPPEST